MFFEIPKLLSAKYILVLLVIMHVLVSTGCGKPPYRQDISKDRDLQEQERILRKARGDFEQGRDTEVINGIHRFLSLYSQSPREGEARWLLAQSYQRSGKLRAALRQYQIIFKESSSEEEQREVTKRIDEINQRLEKVGPPLAPAKVVRTTLGELALIGNDPSILESLVREGVTSVLVDFRCPVTELDQPNAAVKTSDMSTENHLSAFVTQIHREGLQVFVGINLRCVGYLNSGWKKQWLDGFYDPASRRILISRYFDIFHSQYQKLVTDEIKRLTDSQIDGVVFLAEVPLGVYDGFTPSSVNMFNRMFQTRMHPQTLFANSLHSGNSPSSPEREQSSNDFALAASEFWRWTGWKARQRLIILQGVMDDVHEYKPEFRFGLELHPESIDNPLAALTEYSEDFLEANQKSFTFFLVTLRAGLEIRSVASSPDSFNLQEFITHSRRLVDRMSVVLQNPARVWLSIPWGKTTPFTLESESHTARYLQKVSQIYDLQIFLDK